MAIHSVPKAALTSAAQQVCYHNNPKYALKVLGDLTPEQKERIENILQSANNQQPPMKVKDLKRALVFALSSTPGPLSDLFTCPELQLLEKILPFLGAADKESLRTVCKSAEGVVSWPIKLQWYQIAMQRIAPIFNLIKPELCCATSEFSPAGLGYCCYHCELPGLSLTEARKRLVPEKYTAVYIGECMVFREQDITPTSIETVLSGFPGVMCRSLVTLFGEPLIENLIARGKELVIGEPYARFCLFPAERIGREKRWCDETEMENYPIYFPISLLGLTFHGESLLSIAPAIGKSFCFPIHGKLFEFHIAPRHTFVDGEDDSYGSDWSDSWGEEGETVNEDGLRAILKSNPIAVTISYIPGMDSKEKKNQEIVKNTGL
jgi:hypothetical protein